MKSLLLLLLLPVGVFAQDSLLTFTEIVQIPGQTKEQLFIKGRKWINTFFKSSNDVIQIADKETGELSGKGFFESEWHFKQFGKKEAYPAQVYFRFDIIVKDGKYKYEITSLSAKNTIPNSAASKDFGYLTSSLISPVKWPGISQEKMNDIWNDLKKESTERVNLLIESLKISMKQENKSDF